MLDSEERQRLVHEAAVMEVSEFDGLSIDAIINRAFDIRLGTIMSRREIEHRVELLSKEPLEFKSIPVRRTADLRFWRDAMTVVRAIKELKLEKENESSHTHTQS